MSPGIFIALRYLFAKKSHNVINVISFLSAVGMALGTAALVLILSIYNGFDKIIESNISDVEPDLLVCASNGRYFAPNEAVLDSLSTLESIDNISCTLSENVFLVYDEMQSTAKAKGVDAIYEQTSPIRNHIHTGEFSLHFEDVKMASVGAGLAHKMGINPKFKSRLNLYYPGKGESIFASLNQVKLRPASLFSVGTEQDNELIIIPIESMRRLIGVDDNLVSAVEIRLNGKASKAFVSDLREVFGPEFEVQDRYMQNPALYKMMKYEKLAVFAILFFVVLVIAFNIFGSLSMLRIEKENDCQSLRAMGARESLIQMIFLLEGWMVSLLGLIGGLVIGIGAAFAQQELGFLKMPTGFSFDAYPCILELGDIAWIALGVAFIGFVISLAGSRITAES